MNKNGIKSIYISGYITLLFLATIHASIKLSESGWQSAWMGIFLALVPSLLFFIRLFISPIARTSANLNGILICAVAGTVLAFVLATGSHELFYVYLYGCGLSITGAVLYIYWYSRFGREQSQVLKIGEPIPDFSLSNSEGEKWHSKQLEQHPALILFFRGNWCPLCMAQIKEVADQYKKFEQMGIRVYLVSPQPDSHTQALSKKFKVDFQFMVDQNNEAAKQLGIDAPQGTPKGLELLGYDSDTVLPTVIMTDSEGRVIFLDQTDNYRVRPEPETFLRVLSEHGFSTH